MEAAGLSVGLLGLIDSCISAYDKVDAYREYGVASQRLQTRFENQRYLLEQFQAGLADSGDEPSLEGQTAMLALDQKRRRRIEETLKRIRDYLKSHGASAVGAKAGKSSRWTKLKWAAGENRRLAEVSGSLCIVYPNAPLVLIDFAGGRMVCQVCARPLQDALPCERSAKRCFLQQCDQKQRPDLRFDGRGEKLARLKELEIDT